MSDIAWIQAFERVIDRYEHAFITRADAYLELSKLGYEPMDINEILAQVKPKEMAA